MSQKKHNLNYLAETLQRARRAFLMVGCFSLFANLLLLTVPLYMLQLFDRVIPGQSYDTLIFLTLIALFALVIMGCLDVARGFLLTRLSHWLDNKISPEAMTYSLDHVLKGNAGGYQALRDVTSIRHFFTGPSVIALLDSPWVPIYIFVIFLLHPGLGIIALSGAVILFVIGFLNQWATSSLQMESNTLARGAQQFSDSVLNHAESVQAMGMVSGAIKRWFVENNAALALQLKVNDRTSIFTGLSKFTRLVLQLGMLGVGAFLVIQNSITPGVMIAASILMARALAPVEQSIGAWKQLIATKEAYDRIKKHFMLLLNRSAGIDLPAPKGDLKLDNVVYVPPGSQFPVINGVNQRIDAGDVVAIIGPSGAGKTTLARLLIGAYQPRAGHVFLDGADVYTWDRDAFGQHIGYLPQSVNFFPGTISENIARMGEVDDDAVIHAAQRANIHELILQLPEGYATKIGSSLFQLSGGQNQRLALARALYGKPRVFVLDEPNANLDSEGELALVQAIEDMREDGATVVMITHQQSLLKLADQIVVLGRGKVQLSGPRDQVFSQFSELAKKVAAEKVGGLKS